VKYTDPTGMHMTDEDLIAVIADIEKNGTRMGEALPDMVAPTKGTITSEFGPREIIATSSGLTRKGHGGIDIANEEGTPVTAAGSGIVLDRGFSKDYGNYIIIGHDKKGWAGKITIYGHLKETALLEKGSTVLQGQLVGKMGNTGKSTGPHLHFEIRIDGVKVNPRQHVRF
jgi:murein DD-endopeptidase MepM/ murein hydrolase activator NlpD